MTQAELKSNELVKFAESIGFMAYGENVANRRHFYWFLPDSNGPGDHEFSLQQHTDGGISYRVKQIGQYGFTTSYVPDVKKRLAKIKRAVAKTA